MGSDASSAPGGAGCGSAAQADGATGMAHAKYRECFFDLLAAALRALDRFCGRHATHELFELGAARLADVFIDRHLVSTSDVQI